MICHIWFEGGAIERRRGGGCLHIEIPGRELQREGDF